MDASALRGYAAHLLRLPAAAGAGAQLRYSGDAPTGAAPTAEIVASALALGCCARCGLRYAGIAREAVYRLTYPALHAAVTGALEDATTAGALPTALAALLRAAPAPPPTCVACLGLLQEAAAYTLVVDEPPAAKAAARNWCASPATSVGGRGRKGGPPPQLLQQQQAAAAAVASSPSSSAATPTSGSAAAVAVLETACWPDTLAGAVVGSGYDLHGGLAVGVAVPTRLADNDDVVRLRLQALLLAAAAARASAGDAGASSAAGASKPLRGGELPRNTRTLKDDLRAMALNALGRVEVAPLLVDAGATGPARVISPSDFLRLTAAPALLGSAASAAAPDAVAAPTVEASIATLDAAYLSTANLSADDSSSSSAAPTVYVDMGSGVSPLGHESPPPVWDTETHPVMRAALDTAHAAEAAAAQSPAAPYSPLRLSQQSSLQMMVVGVWPGDAQVAAAAAVSEARVAAFKAAVGGGGTADAAPSGALPPLPLAPAHLALVLERGATFLKGRYNKFARGLSQSQWISEGARIGLYESSVEELVGGVLTAQFASASPPGGVALPPVPAARVRAEALAAALGDASVAATAVTSAAGGTSSSTAAGCVATASPPLPGVGYKFHAAGREDVDVRMLGRGRPCLVELMDARRVLVPAPAFAALQRHINAVAATSLPFLPDVESGEGGEGAAYPPSTPLIGLRWLAPATKEEFAALSAGADSKRKRYAAAVWVSVPHTAEQLQSKLECLKDVQVSQRTPVRVLHRRTLLARPKVMHELRVAAWRDPHHFTLELLSSAGAYIKEFVHGDFGRTTPNLGSLLGDGCEADIYTLDVVELLEFDTTAAATTGAGSSGAGAGSSLAAADNSDDDDEGTGGDEASKRARVDGAVT